MVFYNPLARDLEGELAMPLGDGQEISRYALEINGKLREGVVVEKIKARQTFEAIVRQNIDPGIINMTKGNFFKTKIYPVPALGHKRVVLALTETLAGDDQNMYYAIPVAKQLPIGQFNLDVKVIKGQSDEPVIRSEFENLEFDRRDDASLLHFQRKNYTLSEALKFTIPRFATSDHQLFACELDGTTYFYLNIKAPELNSITKMTPQKIAIYWDNSHSASARNIEKELSLLSAYLTGLEGRQEVSFASFNYKPGDTKVFIIDHDASALIAHIRQLHNDGATRIDHIKFDNDCDEILLFSDAINTLGEEMKEMPQIPCYTVSSSSGSNYALLKRLSSSSNGAFIDLSVKTVAEGVAMMKADEEKLLSIDFNKAQITEVYPDMSATVDEYVEVVGILLANKAELTLNYGHKGKVTNTRRIEIGKGATAPVSRIWASKKIESLERNFDQHEDQILQLGKQHSIVTRNSALLVLDRVEDYVEHDIPPPDELKDAYDKLMAAKVKTTEISPITIHERNMERAEQLKAWYVNPVMKHTKDNLSLIEVSDAEEIEEEIEITLDMAVREETVIEEVVFEEAPEEQLADMIYGLQSTNKAIVGDQKAKSSIKVLAWLPDAPYMSALRKAKEHEFEALYFQLKAENTNRPAFYVQVADLFFEKGMADMGIRVLSNALELDLENPELLKLVARRLLDEKEYELAILIYKEIKVLRPEEPQSFRDLALAYVEHKQYQDALGMMTHILDHEWGRFDDIKDIVLNELSCLYAQHKNTLEISELQKQYIHAMPLDVRITIDWSSNDNDIDLWVIDPNGEKCFYSHPRTKLGGKMSRDFTQGYGPEEFTLKNAKRGMYTVFVNYYSELRQTITGPVTIYATLYSNYGRSNQEAKKIAIQLADNKETRQIGQLEFEL